MVGSSVKQEDRVMGILRAGDDGVAQQELAVPYQREDVSQNITAMSVGHSPQ